METLLRDAKERLLSQRAALARKHESHREEERERQAEPEGDWPDRAATQSDAEVLHHMTDHEQVELREIDEALGRIEDGTYGECQGCGEPIARPRLVALPQARLCVACARRADEASA